LEEHQQSALSNPSTIRSLVVEMNGKASFVAQQNVLIIQLIGNPTEKTWNQVEQTISKHIGTLIPVQTKTDT